jgi:hypothetical protein
MKTSWLFLTAILAIPHGQQPEPFKQSATEHIIRTVQQPFEVRSIQGVVIEKVADLSPFPDVAFEVRGAGTNGKVIRVTTDDRGRFRFGHLPDGTYEFKATLNGFQSVEGKILLSKKAPRRNRIAIEMLLGA